MIFSPLLSGGADLSVNQGTASQTIAVSQSHAGAVAVIGQASKAIDVVQSAVGSVLAQGASAQSIAVTQAAAGVALVSGQAAQAIAVSPSAAGVVAVVGTKAATITVNQTAVLWHDSFGAASKAIPIVQTAIGDVSSNTVAVLPADRNTRVSATPAHVFGVSTELTEIAERFFFGVGTANGELIQPIIVFGDMTGTTPLAGVHIQTIAVACAAAAETGGVEGGGQSQGQGSALTSPHILRERVPLNHEFANKDPSLSTLLKDYFFGAQDGVVGSLSQAVAVSQGATGNVATPRVGALNKQIVVTQSAYSGFLFQPGVKLITVGDSIMQFAGRRDQTTNNIFGNDADGEINWAFMRRPGFRHVLWVDPNASIVGFGVGQSGAVPPRFRGANFGIAGDWAANLRDNRMAEILNSGADIAVVNIGTNNGGIAGSQAHIDAIADIVAQLRAKGIFVILGVMRPRNYQDGTSINAGYKVRNDEISDWVRTQGAPDVLIWDMEASILDPSPDSPLLPGSPYPWALRDATHLSPQGAYATAQSLADLLEDIIAPGTWFDSDPFTGNLVTNGGLTGNTSTAVVSPSVTGVGPTNWTARNTTVSGALVSAVASLEANAETGGQSWVLDITTQGGGDAGGGGSYTEVIAVRPTALNVTSLGLTSDQYVQFFAEIEVDASPEGVIGKCQLVIATNWAGPWGGVGNITYRGLGQESNSALISPYPSEAYSGWIQTEPLLIGANTTLTPTMQFEGRRDLDTGLSLSERTCRVKIKRLVARVVEDPRITFPFEKQGLAAKAIPVAQTAAGSIGAASSVTGSANQPIPISQGGHGATSASQGRGRAPLQTSLVTREALTKNHAHHNRGTAVAQVSADYFFGYQTPEGVARQPIPLSQSAVGTAGRVGVLNKQVPVLQTAAGNFGESENQLVDGSGNTLQDASGAWLEASGVSIGDVDQTISVIGAAVVDVGPVDDGQLVDASGAYLLDSEFAYLSSQELRLGEAAKAITVTQVAIAASAISGTASGTIAVLQSGTGSLGEVDGQLVDSSGAFLYDGSGDALQGDIILYAEADQLIEIGQSASGNVQNVIHGTADQSVTVGRSAAGGVEVSGAASQSITIDQTAANFLLVNGRGNRQVVVTQSATGEVPALGAADQPIAVTQSAGGSAPAIGTLAQAIEVSQVSTGLTIFYQGAANQVITVGHSADGLTVFYQGQGSQPILVTQSATGELPIVGQGDKTLAILQAATGGAIASGVANQNILVRQSASGGITETTQPSVVSGIAHLLIATASVYRDNPASDGRGGWTENLVLVGTVACRISSPSGRDTQLAALRQAVVTHAVYMGSDADIRYGDLLQINGTWHFVQVPDLRPSIRGHHLKILTEERQRRAA